MSNAPADYLEDLHPIQNFYIGFDECLTTVALTVPLDGASLPDNPVLEKPDQAVVMGYENKGYLSPSTDWDMGYIPNGDKSPKLAFIEVQGNRISAAELKGQRVELINTYLTGLLGQKALTTLRNGLETLGIAEGEYLYRATHKEERFAGRAVLLNHRGLPTNFETQQLFEGNKSQVRYFAGHKNYSGDIVRIRIEEPAFYLPAGTPSEPRVIPAFSHYIEGKNLEVSKDEGITWKPAV